jgi:hypothetical protein
MDFCAPESLGKGDRNFDLKIIPQPDKDGMLPDRQDDEKVSRRAAILAHLPFSSYPQAGALLRARGSLDGEGLGSL